jgi:hypothetical protein
MAYLGSFYHFSSRPVRFGRSTSDYFTILQSAQKTRGNFVVLGTENHPRHAQSGGFRYSTESVKEAGPMAVHRPLNCVRRWIDRVTADLLETFGRREILAGLVC